MYKFKEEYMESTLQNNLSKMAKEIGITYQYLTAIVHNKRVCKKKIAYCITKFLDKNAEINKYFIEII